VAALIYRAKTEHVLATMIEGRVVYRAGEFAYVDRDNVLAALAEELGSGETPAEAARAALSKRLLPHIKDFYRDWPLPDGEPWYKLNGR